MTTPEAPTGVVLHTPSGAHPADLTYVGVRADGIHVWHADTVAPVDEVLHITVDKLPAKTLLMLPVGAGR